MFTKLLLLLTLSAPLVAQPTFFKIASEGTSQTASPVVTLTAGMTYRFGSGTKWCDSVTVTGATKLTVWVTSIACTVNGQAVSDVDSGVNKELDVAEQASALKIPVTTGTVVSSVSVPALPPPPVTVYATTCTTTVSAAGLISIVLNATPTN